MRILTRSINLLSGITAVGLAIWMLGVTGCASNGDQYRTSAQYQKDLDLAENVRSALETAPVFKYPDVKVSAYRGTVQLSGFVATEAQRQEATAIAHRVHGVDRVENSLLLKRTPDSPVVGEYNNPPVRRFR